MIIVCFYMIFMRYRYIWARTIALNINIASQCFLLRDIVSILRYSNIICGKRLSNGCCKSLISTGQSCQYSSCQNHLSFHHKSSSFHSNDQIYIYTFILLPQPPLFNMSSVKLMQKTDKLRRLFIKTISEKARIFITLPLAMREPIFAVPVLLYHHPKFYEHLRSR